MSKLNYYTFFDKVLKEDTNLLNYYLFKAKYENCPKNNILMDVDVDKMLNKENKFINKNLSNYTNTYLINKTT